MVASDAKPLAEGAFGGEEPARAVLGEDHDARVLLDVALEQAPSGDHGPIHQGEPVGGGADDAQFEASVEEAALLSNDLDGGGALDGGQDLADPLLVLVF